FRAAGLDPLAITITGGHTASQVNRRAWNVPKRDLIAVVQILLQSGRLRFAARIPEAAILQRELANFRVRITAAANETYAAWRENEHDDTVLALALACWAAERGLPRQLRVW